MAQRTKSQGKLAQACKQQRQIRVACNARLREFNLFTSCCYGLTRASIRLLWFYAANLLPNLPFTACARTAHVRELPRCCVQKPQARKILGPVVRPDRKPFFGIPYQFC